MSLLSPSTGSGGPALSSQGQAACQPQKPDLGLSRLATRLLDQTTGHHRPPSAAVCLAASRPGQARRCGIRPAGGTPWLHRAQPAGPAGPQPTRSLPVRHSPPPSAALPDDAGLSQRLQEDMATSLPTRAQHQLSAQSPVGTVSPFRPLPRSTLPGAASAQLGADRSSGQVRVEAELV
ncbi:hypothetical protein MJG53_013036 [Ovis ammon polii x Ovis aries]|uniref:Uncharacterized protein n=2 Tax=Ovis TaxID=9935 RepID=A0A835ZZ73_SHEEP|nr:hypothetical protein JEQ12_008102 [Ovis aries]KAI4573198.1 hypothetical protein MJG53_013036 [Ovis ammon polii x Ovis aries]